MLNNFRVFEELVFFDLWIPDSEFRIPDSGFRFRTPDSGSGIRISVSRDASIMPNRPVRDQWEFPSKMERHFPIKPGQPLGMALATICFSSEFPSKGKQPVCQKWNDKFRSEYSDRTKRTTSRGDPEYSGQKKPKRSFPFEFQPKFPESLAQWKAPLVLGLPRPDSSLVPIR